MTLWCHSCYTLKALTSSMVPCDVTTHVGVCPSDIMDVTCQTHVATTVPDDIISGVRICPSFIFMSGCYQNWKIVYSGKPAKKGSYQLQVSLNKEKQIKTKKRKKKTKQKKHRGKNLACAKSANQLNKVDINCGFPSGRKCYSTQAQH